MLRDTLFDKLFDVLRSLWSRFDFWAEGDEGAWDFCVVDCDSRNSYIRDKRVFGKDSFELGGCDLEAAVVDDFLQICVIRYSPRGSKDEYGILTFVRPTT